MTEPRRTVLPVVAPSIAPPPPHVERRIGSRRAADKAAHDAAILLARMLDVLAAERSAEQRLAGLLALLARTVGARRAAVVADGSERRVAVSIGRDEDEDAATGLAAWLDAQAPRSRAERAAARPSPISFAVLLPADEPRPDPRPAHYSCVAIARSGSVSLGFDFVEHAAAASVADRLPPSLARHAAVALALVTEQLAAEREVALLRARDTERARFVSTVAHELRTPLTGLGGYLDLILGGRVDDRAVEIEFLERSQGIVASMTELVGDLLELSRLESGTVGLELRPISIHDVGSRVVAQLDPIAMERGIEIRSDLPPRLRTATADRRRVEQILTNIGGNALKFSAPGGRVDLAGWFDGPVALIAVRDDGAGIDIDERVRIFEPYYRMTGHERVAGTGLGLPIARELARAMGGDLDVASVMAAGSSFILALPGPAAVEPQVIAASLGRALAAEEIRIEERSVIRAIQAAGRAVELPPLRALGTSDRVIPPHVDHDDGQEAFEVNDDAVIGLETADGLGPRTLPRLVGPRSAGASASRLRAIDSGSDRTDAPTPA